MNYLRNMDAVRQTLRLVHRTCRLLFFIGFTNAAFGQGPTSGSVSGTVQDSSDAILPSVKVTISSPSLVVPQSTLSSDQGTYRFISLPPGAYQLSFEVPGLAVTKREGIAISAGFSATINVQMGVATQSQTVAVTSESPVIDTQNTNIQNTFSTQTMKDLPTSRDMFALVAIAPGTTVQRFDVGGSTTGTQTPYYTYGMTGQQRVQMDGVNMTEGNSATSAYNDLGSFAEVQMGTTGNDASMPSPGAQINFVVKSGGNAFHGDFYQDYENSNFQGSNISRQQLNQGAGLGTRVTGYRDTNGGIGGPILRDKLWFFASARRQYVGTTITGFPVDNASAGPSYDTTLDNLTYKLTYQLNEKNRISHFLNFNRKQQPFRNAANNQYENAVYLQDMPQWTGKVEWESTITSKLFLDVRLGIWGYNWTNRGYTDSNGALFPRQVENQSGNVYGTYNGQRYNRDRDQVEVTASYALDRFLGVGHNLTFGFLTEKEFYGLETYPYLNNAQLTFNSPAGATDFTTPYQVTISNGPTAPRDYLRHNGAYLQDKVKLTRRLTLNLGVRWDYYNTTRPTQTIRGDIPYRAFFYGGQPLSNGYTIPTSFPDYTIPGSGSTLRYPNSFAPRLGFNWDIFGTGKTTIKASWGRYYQNPSLVISSAANPLQNLSYTFGWNDINRDKQFQQDEFGSFASSSGSANNTIAPNIRHPYMDDTNVFVEHEIMRDTVVRVGFVYRKLAHDWQLSDVSRTFGLYTLPVTRPDPGADGLAGTGDDSTLTVYDIPRTPGASLPPSVRQYQSPEGNNQFYRNLDVTVSKRMSKSWSLVGNYLVTWSNYTNFYDTSNTSYTYGVPNNPNQALFSNASVSLSTFKLFGTYNAPWGLIVSPIYRFQQGSPLQREVIVTGLNIGQVTVPTGPLGEYRQDNVSILDTRVEKQFSIGEKYKVGAFFDAFNILNSNAAQAQDNIVGRRTALVDGNRVNYQRFLSPTNVISPRIFRIGAKFTF